MRWSIKYKIIILAVAVSLLAAFVVTWVSIRQVTLQVNKQLNETGQGLLESVQNHIRQDLEKAERFADLLATHHQLREYLLHPDAETLVAWLNKQSEMEIYALLEIFDREGNRVAVNRWLNKDSDELMPYLTDQKDPVLQAALNYQISAEIKQLTQGLSIRVTVPIVDIITIKVLGVCVVSFPMNYDWIDRIRAESSYHLALIANSQSKLATSVITPEGRRMEELPVEISQNISGDLPGQIEQISLFDHSYMVLFAPIYDPRSIAQGQMIALMQRDLIESTTEQILNVLVFVALATVLGCVILGTFVAYGMTKPLQRLMEAMHRIAEGDLDQTIKVSSRDEIGELTQAAQWMQDELRTIQDLVDKMLQTFQLFVPTQFLRHIAHDGIENVKLGNAQQETVSVLFSDIRGFTTISESMSPQQLLDFLNLLFRQVGKAIEQYGFIDKFIGDAVMAVFEGEAEDYSGAQNAVTTALIMQTALQKFRNENHSPVEIGIGINTGPVVIGTVGTSSRMDSTVLGDTVNLASRMEGLTKNYGGSLLISENTFKQLPNTHCFQIRAVDKVRVKGKKEPITVYEVFDNDSPPVLEKKLGIQNFLEQGQALYYSRQWQEALDLFQKCFNLFPEDVVSQMYLDRCREFFHHPPPRDWDGVISMKTK
ncbi:MAG: HAMP domain-containing protein [SAR324 cluster bacterium]|nr:HAMP domain-containing protein [SAR324 cluster bacterium]